MQCNAVESNGMECDVMTRITTRHSVLKYAGVAAGSSTRAYLRGLACLLAFATEQHVPTYNALLKLKAHNIL